MTITEKIEFNYIIQFADKEDITGTEWAYYTCEVMVKIRSKAKGAKLITITPKIKKNEMSNVST